jgi:single-strand DNA-binding protein
MPSYNKVIVVGNLTRDPALRYTPGGTAVADIGLAVNRSWFDKQANQKKEEVTFIDVTLWGRNAEVAGEYLSKGRSVLIEGRLTLDQWTDKETREKRSKLKVVGEMLQMLSPKGETGKADDDQRQSGKRSKPSSDSRDDTANDDSFYDEGYDQDSFVPPF